jgi:parvulin-like peptidyl-prolyl isomerase
MLRTVRGLVPSLLLSTLAACGGNGSGDAGRSGDTASGESAVLAQVGEARITAADFREVLRTMDPGERPDSLSRTGPRLRLLQDLINRELMEQASREMNPRLLPFQQDRNTTFRRTYLEQVYRERFLDPRVRLTEKDKDLYYEHAKTEVRLDLLVLPDREAAEAMIDRLRDGADFGDLADTYSVLDYEDPDRPGDAGWVGAGNQPWEAQKAIWASGRGEVVGPFEDAWLEAWVVARVSDRRPSGETAPRDSVDARIEDTLRRKMFYAVRKAVLDSLRTAADPQFSPDVVPLLMERFRFVPPPGKEDDPLAHLSTPRALPGFSAEEDTMTVVSFADRPDWTVADFNRILSVYPPGFWPRGESLDQLYEAYDLVLRNELIIQAAVDAGIEQDPEYLRRMKQRETQMRVRYLHRTLLSQVQHPTEEDLLQWFEENRDRYRLVPHYRVAYFSSSDRDLIASLRRDWMAGREFGELRDGYGERNPELVAVGETPWLIQGSEPELDAALLDREEGTITDVISRDGEYAVYRLVAKRISRLASFAEAREMVESDLLARRRDRVIDEFIEERRSATPIVVYEEAVEAMELPADLPAS